MENVKCTCKRKSCKRFGKCDACIAYHMNHPKYPVPFCKKKEKALAQKSVK